MKNFILLFLSIAVFTALFSCSDSEPILVKDSCPKTDVGQDSSLFIPPDEDDDPKPIDIVSSTVGQNGGIVNYKVRISNALEADSAITDITGGATTQVSQAGTYDWEVFDGSVRVVHRIVQVNPPLTILRDSLP
ncbi:MAG: hypothetical protein JJ975_15885 [Bacteroidia bacterium]|nr:hypothetical protein [Bacteroidia bacterium]